MANFVELSLSSDEHIYVNMELVAALYLNMSSGGSMRTELLMTQGASLFVKESPARVLELLQTKI